MMTMVDWWSVVCGGLSWEQRELLDIALGLLLGEVAKVDE